MYKKQNIINRLKGYLVALGIVPDIAVLSEKQLKNTKAY